MTSVRELPTRDGVSDERRSPEGDEQIQADDLAQIVAARLPMLGEFVIAAVFEIADVMNRDGVADKVGPRKLGNVRLPRAVVSRRQRQPPAPNDAEKSAADQQPEFQAAADHERRDAGPGYEHH